MTKVKFDFKSTLATNNLWIFSFAYHFAVYFLNDWLSRPFITFSSATSNISVSPLEVVNQALVPNEGKPLGNPFLQLLTQLIIFDVIFVLMYYLVNRSHKKLYSLVAIFISAFTMSTLYILFSRLVYINYMKSLLGN